MSLLKEILSKKKKLQHCKTLVSTPTGETWVEDRGSVTRVSNAPSFAGYVVDLCPDLQMAEVIPHLYLGSQDPTADEQLLHSHGITHILSIGVKPGILSDTCIDGKEVLLYHNITVKYIPLLDVPEASLSEFFGDCFSFIDNALLSNGNIFVHCNAGISRSPSVVIAYVLLRSHSKKPWASVPESDIPLALNEVIELVRSARSCIKPNPGFFRQLCMFEASL